MEMILNGGFDGKLICKLGVSVAIVRLLEGICMEF
jgi:hypothetical protein